MPRKKPDDGGVAVTAPPEISLPPTVAQAEPQEPQEMPALRSRLEPHECIDPVEHYTCEQLERLLGIPRVECAHGIMTANLGLVELRGCSDLRSSPNGEVLGRSVREWLRHKRPACNLPAGARPFRRWKPAAPTPAAPPERAPRTPGERLERELRDRAEADQAARNDDEREAWRALVPLLELGDGRTPADTTRLVELANDYGIDAATLARATDAVAEAASLRELLSRRKEIHRAAHAAHENLTKVKAETEEALRTAQKARRRADNESTRVSSAEAKLRLLTSRWPMIFAGEVKVSAGS